MNLLLPPANLYSVPHVDQPQALITRKKDVHARIPSTKEAHPEKEHRPGAALVADPLRGHTGEAIECYQVAESQGFDATQCISNSQESVPLVSAL